MTVHHRARNKKLYLLRSIAAVIWSLLLTVMCLWLYAHGAKRLILLLPVMQLFGLIPLLYIDFSHRRDYSVDASGIRVFSGSRTLKTASWQEFAYVGELEVYNPFSPTKTQTVIVCSPEPPKPLKDKAGCYEFPRRRSITIDHTPEDAQRMTPYFKGSPVGSAADL